MNTKEAKIAGKIIKKVIHHTFFQPQLKINFRGTPIIMEIDIHSVINEYNDFICNHLAINTVCNIENFT